jgi:hypothetical protein
VDAKKTIPHDIAREKATQARINKQKVLPYEELLAQVSELEAENYLKHHYTQIAPAIWVAPQDPTCFIYDEKYKPFQYKDGWSTEQMGEILEEWFEALTGHKVTAKHILNAPW